MAAAICARDLQQRLAFMHEALRMDEASMCVTSLWHSDGIFQHFAWSDALAFRAHLKILLTRGRASAWAEADGVWLHLPATFRAGRSSPPSRPLLCDIAILLRLCSIDNARCEGQQQQPQIGDASTSYEGQAASMLRCLKFLITHGEHVHKEIG